jgi:hypothetical protein
MTAGTRACPNEIVSLFSDAAAGQARRIDLAGANSLQHVLHRRAPAAAPAHRAAHRAVNLDDPQRRVPGPLVQLIDVLGDQRVQLAALLQFHQRQVATIRARLPRGMRDTAAPRGLAHLRVGQVGLQRRLLLGRRIGGPQAQRAAKIGDA